MSEPRAGSPHDFVDRLVAKAFGTPDAAAPRVPSTYEPTPPGRAGVPSPGGAMGEGEDGPGGASRTAMSGAAWLDAMQAAGDAGERGAVDLSGARGAGAAAASSFLAASEMTSAGATARRGAATTGGGLTSSGMSTGDRDAASVSSSLLSRSSLSRTLSSPSSVARGRGVNGEAHAGADGSLVSADLHAGRLGPSDGVGGDAGARESSSAHARVGADAASNAAAEEGDGGSLGRSPFDTRSGARAGDGFSRGGGHGRGGGADGSDEAREQDAQRLWARLGETDRRDRESARRDVDLDDARARDGALLSRDGGLALRLADGSAARGEDRWSRLRSGEAGAAEHDVTVNVTIGRVEVRAVQASTSPAKQTRARGPQPLALDDYLRQRGGAR
jgi:hypothetical protein